MKINLKWLREYVNIEENPENFAEDLTMFGLNVEKVEKKDPEFEGVVFGRIAEVTEHPKADRLKICRVDVGGESLLNIVCGAPNVRKGLGVPVAVSGAVLPGNFKIKKTKLRGQVSEGMICSESELKIGNDSSGIMELNSDFPCGTDLSDELTGTDVVLDIEVTPNRPDQLSYIGIAREAAAMYDLKLNKPGIMDLQTGGDFKIEIEDFEDCPRYSAALIDNIKIKESPEWMKRYLISIGIKPVNNIVDITNYVLMETGHPLHAFDRDKLAEAKILVRRAVNGEKIITIDGRERELKSHNLVITDGVTPIAVAGVMGGVETEITEDTRSVLLESAVFSPKIIRQSKRELNLDTEASYRFERGSDINITRYALGRACRMIEDLEAGNVNRLCLDSFEGDIENYKKDIIVSRGNVNRIMGTNLSSEEIASHLEKLKLKSIVDEDILTVSVPTFRLDLNEEVDIIEEAARVYGYNNIKGEGAGLINTFPIIDPTDKRNEYLTNYLASRGFAEVITSSFMSEEDLEIFGLAVQGKHDKSVKISNPLTSSQSLLRTSLIPGLLRVIDNNSSNEQRGLKIFEMGKVFYHINDGDGLPGEETHLAAVFNRNAVPRQWIEKEREFDFFDMKGELESIFSIFNRLEDTEMVRKEERKNPHIFQWVKKNKLIAECGRISSQTAARYNIDSQIFYFVVFMDNLKGEKYSRERYTKPSPYPAIKRDLCVITEERVTFSEIKKVIYKNSKYLESIQLFDYYTDSSNKNYKRSYTFTLSFRSHEATLKDNKIDKIIEKILRALERKLKVFLRKE
ncbi:MAG: phenylalanine--tRNA ligase subunit beta [Candidatus Krumholzibacteriota bacterium]|nr:phenylalanine--tRNA ligase subunit beta [Candidatus Krumholzibacteriota bacterium]